MKGAHIAESIGEESLTEVDSTYAEQVDSTAMRKFGSTVALVVLRE